MGVPRRFPWGFRGVSAGFPRGFRGVSGGFRGFPRGYRTSGTLLWASRGTFAVLCFLYENVHFRHEKHWSGLFPLRPLSSRRELENVGEQPPFILQGLGLSRKMARRGHSNGDRFGSVRARVLIVSIASLRLKRSTKKK